MSEKTLKPGWRQMLFGQRRTFWQQMDALVGMPYGLIMEDIERV